MGSKFSLLPILTGQLDTLVDVRTGKRRFEDIFVMAVVPLLAGGASVAAGWRLAAVGELIAGVTILASFLFALAVFVFQLRIQLGRELNGSVNARTVRLVDELFTNTCWSIVVGLFTTAFTIVASATRATIDGTVQPVGTVMTGILLALSIHLVACLSMGLKRLYIAYTRINN